MSINVKPFYSEEYNKNEILQILQFLDSPVGNKIVKELDWLINHYETQIKYAAMGMTLGNIPEKTQMILSGKDVLAQLMALKQKFLIADLDKIYTAMVEEQVQG